MNAIASVSRACDKAARAILVPIVLVMFLVIIMGVVSRYVFHRPMVGSFELSRILFMWAWLFGATVALKCKAHIGYEFLTQKLPPRARCATLLAGYLVALWFFYVLAAQGVGMMHNAGMQKMPALEISMTWIHLPIPIAAAVMGIHTLADVFETATALFARGGAAATGGCAAAGEAGAKEEAVS